MGDTRVGDDEPAAVAACYRSVRFPDGPYRSESGTLTVTAVTNERLDGTFDVVAYTSLQTGPATAQRVRVRLTGAFSAVRGASSRGDNVRACGGG